MESWTQIISTLGVSGVLTIAWYLTYQQLTIEREYSRKLIDENDTYNKAMLERALKGLHDAETAIRAGVESQTAATSNLSTLRDMLMVKGSQQ